MNKAKEGINGKLIEALNKTLPPVFGRSEISRLLPGIISPKTLANHHTNGTGPESSRIGRKRIYLRDDFVDWLATRFE